MNTTIKFNKQVFLYLSIPKNVSNSRDFIVSQALSGSTGFTTEREHLWKV